MTGGVKAYMQADTLGLQASTMNSSGFDDFYRTHRADAVRWATALVGSREIGEEIAQDALVAVGRKLDGLTNPGGYLRRAVVNRAASWHRWHIRERSRGGAAPRPDSRSPTPNPPATCSTRSPRCPTSSAPP